MTLVPWLRRHPLIGYFALAYGISCGGILIVLSATGFDLVELRPLDTGLIFVLMLLGPSTSGLVLTALLEGRAGWARWVEPDELEGWHALVRVRPADHAVLPTRDPVALECLRGSGVRPPFSVATVRDHSSLAASRKSDGRVLRHRDCWHDSGCERPACRSA